MSIAPHWATHILKHIPGEILFYSNTGDLTAFTKPRLQPLENQPAYSLSGFEFPGPVQNWEVVKPVTPDLHEMIIDQNPERRTEQRKPTTSFDWELQQALIHLQNAISVTDSRRGHLLQAAVSIAKGVRESD